MGPRVRAGQLVDRARRAWVRRVLRDRKAQPVIADPPELLVPLDEPGPEAPKDHPDPKDPPA